MVRILEVTADKQVIDHEVEGNLLTYQTLVGEGYIDRIVLSGDAFTPGVDLVINDEGLLREMPFTILLRSPWQEEPQPIAGPCFFVRHNDEGDWVSLTDEDIQFCMDSIIGYAVSNGPLVMFIDKEDLVDGNDIATK
jgi:hypothetical protein